MVISPLEHPNLATGDPWAGQPRYSNAIAGVAAGLIGLAAIKHHFFPSTKGGRLTALGRYLAGRTVGPPSFFRRRSENGQQEPHVRPSSISLGVLLLMSIFFLIPFTVATFAIMPYYRTLRIYGSPPLAVRAGFMALGTMPFLYATSAKVSYLNVLTGIKSETWLVWHGWGARFCFFLATVHTIPFLLQPAREGGASQLATEFKSDNIYTTGVLAYVALALLVLPSGRQLRQRWYSLWLAIHLPVALVFLAAMWIHCENILTSWQFMYAATFFYLLNIALRLGKMFQNSDLFLHTTAELSVYSLPDSDPSTALTRIVVPTMARWKPGQHVFIRLLPSWPSGTTTGNGASVNRLNFVLFWFQCAAHSHPFTIVSLPPEDEHAPLGHMVLLARATGRKAGWTQQLAHWVQLLASVPSQESESDSLNQEKPIAKIASIQWTVLVDGPFGAISTPSLRENAIAARKTSGMTVVERRVAALESRSPLARHDGALFICGGSGITFGIGLLLELVWARSKAEALVSTTGKPKDVAMQKWPRKVRFIWTVREEAHIAWAAEQLQSVTDLVTGDWLQISIHVTGSRTGASFQASAPSLPSISRSESSNSKKTDGASEVGVRADLHDAELDEPHLSDAVPILRRDAGADSDADADTAGRPWTVCRGERIDANVVLREFLGSIPSRGGLRNCGADAAPSSSTTPLSTGLVICGPPSLAEDAQRAANSIQADIARGWNTAVDGIDPAVEVGQLEVLREDFGW
ncbi:hypothetical protein OC861_003886 [Tilletia horrida]|nr:hypothetical protein OC861_003886 [Tilletia horrida]